jgi:hypothetical protein
MQRYKISKRNASFLTKNLNNMQKTTQNNENRVRRLTAGRRLMFYLYIIIIRRRKTPDESLHVRLIIGRFVY